MASNLNPMAHLSLREPFHIGSELILSVVEGMLNVEFTLSLPKGCSTFTSSSVFCLLPSVFCPLQMNNEQFKLFMQNKPNLRDTQINVTSVTLNNYEDNRPPNPAKANPKQSQFNPIKTQFNPIQTQFQKRPKMNVTKVLTTHYENKRLPRLAENKPNQTQFQTRRRFFCEQSSTVITNCIISNFGGVGYQEEGGAISLWSWGLNWGDFYREMKELADKLGNERRFKGTKRSKGIRI